MGGPAAPGSWSHAVGTFDSTTARLYVAGVQVASGAAGNTGFLGAAEQRGEGGQVRG